MKRIVILLFVLIMIFSMAVSAFALTPRWEYKPPKLPQIKPDTSFVQGAISKWFVENPIDLPPIKIEFTSPTLG